MKKSVVLTLIAVYILSICVVGYFGLKVKIYRPTKYAESVTIESVRNATTGATYNIKDNGEYGKSVRVRDAEDDGVTLVFVVNIRPDNTTNKELLIEFANSEVCEVIRGSSPDGGAKQEITIKFKEKTGCTVTFWAKDLKKCSDSVTVSFASV